MKNLKNSSDELNQIIQVKKPIKPTLPMPPGCAPVLPEKFYIKTKKINIISHGLSTEKISLKKINELASTINSEDINIEIISLGGCCCGYSDNQIKEVNLIYNEFIENKDYDNQIQKYQKALLSFNKKQQNYTKNLEKYKQELKEYKVKLKEYNKLKK